jgi:hypothetical protein
LYLYLTTSLIRYLLKITVYKELIIFMLENLSFILGFDTAIERHQGAWFHALASGESRQCLLIYGGEIHTTNMDMQSLVVIILPLMNCEYIQAHEK